MSAAFVGMETSGVTRRALIERGIEAISCDLLHRQDNPVDGAHIVGDVFETLDWLWTAGRWPDFGVFHPDCTYLTNSAAWAFGDPDMTRFPGVGYHQKVKPGTKVGAARRTARDEAVEMAYRIRALKMRVKVIENPIGHLSSKLGRATQIVQPYQFGHDASKGTCLWVYVDGELLPPQEWLPLDPAAYVPPTLRANGKRYWANQTDTGQNRLSPSGDRWAKRADTYPGIVAAIAERIAGYARGEGF